MRLLKCLALVAAALTLTAGNAVAQTTVRWLHIEANPAQVKIWEEVARAFEAKNPGVKIEMQFLENEAYKAKLPTILQSKDRPHIIYSWAGGVLKAQIEAGVLEDISAPMKGYSDSLAPAAVAAFTQDGKIYGVPMVLSQVVFLYNKELMAKAGVDGATIKTWDDLLAATKKLKAAGVTPIAVGGADKWPLHFYWTYLAMRAGGKPAFDAALRGESGGFSGETFVKAGELFKQLVDLQPFQTGFLGFKNQPAVGYFGDGKAAMTLALNNVFLLQRVLAADKVGLSDDKLGWFAFPTVSGGKGDASDTLGGITGWLVTKGVAEGGRRVPQVPRLAGRPEASRGRQLSHSGGQRRRYGLDQHLHARHRAEPGALEVPPELPDQTLGPSVGRVVNDVTAEIAGGSMTPKDAAKAIQDAWKQGN